MIFLKNKHSTFSKLEDNELVAAIVHENDRALLRRMQEEVYGRFAEKIFAKCVTMVRDRELAKDLSHDIIVKIFLNLSKFRGNAPFSAWVYTITYNHCLTYLQKKKRLKLENFDVHGFDIAADEIELENKILKDLKLSQLERLMEEISAAERAILLMRYQDGMSVKQISKVMKLGDSAVKMRLKRSRDHLAELLKESGHDQ